MGGVDSLPGGQLSSFSQNLLNKVVASPFPRLLVRTLGTFSVFPGEAG